MPVFVFVFGGFDATYIVEDQDFQLNVVLFHSKYTRNLDKDSNFPANAVEKAVNTIKCVFDPAAQAELNPENEEKVNEIRSFILDGQIPYVTFVMFNIFSPDLHPGKNQHSLPAAYLSSDRYFFQYSLSLHSSPYFYDTNAKYLSTSLPQASTIINCQ